MQVRAVEAALSAQAVQLRALAQGAVRAGEEQCRRVEAAAGVRLAQLGVRLRDMVAKVRVPLSPIFGVRLLFTVRCMLF